MNFNPQQTAFVNLWSPYATQVGNSIGVDPNLVLSQWALESGWNTPNTFNVGGIGGSNPASFASPQDFANNYLNLLNNGYGSALGAGSNIDQFVTGLANGSNGSYFGSQSPASYEASLQPVYDQLSGNQPASSETSTNTGSFWHWLTAPVSPLTQGLLLPGSVSPGAMAASAAHTAVGGWIIRGAIGVLALILIAVGLAALALKTDPEQVVQRAVKTVG